MHFANQFSTQQKPLNQSQKKKDIKRLQLMCLACDIFS